MSELKTPFKIKWLGDDEIYTVVDGHVDTKMYTVHNSLNLSDYSKISVHDQIDRGRIQVIKDDPVSTTEATPDVTTEGGTGAIKSDGGSSSYYDIPIPDWLVDLIVERRYIKTEELIEVLGGNFDEGNILKCLVRINSLRNGKGKEGNNVDYDCNKVIYSANRIKEVCSR